MGNCGDEAERQATKEMRLKYRQLHRLTSNTVHYVSTVEIHSSM
jgi:hypothetical protein